MNPTPHFFAALFVTSLHLSSFVDAEHRNLRFGRFGVDRECPTESYPKQGFRCVPGLVCEYDHTTTPTILSDGTCSEPVLCTPMTSYNCGTDGHWEPPQIAAAVACAANETPRGMDMPCAPAIPCPEEIPEAGTGCESGGLVCKYDYVFTPRVTADGSCSETLSCGPPARVRCGDDGFWGDPIVWDTSCPKSELSDQAYTPCMAIQPIDEECPDQPSKGGMCKAGLSCDYNYINVPGVSGGVCTDTLRCLSVTHQQCNVDGFWEAPTTMDFLPCPNDDVDLPAGAYRPCEINDQLDLEIIDTECPIELSTLLTITGKRCETGLRCGYEHLWVPTVLDDGTCQEPVTCAPKVTIECRKDGIWGDIMMKTFACIGADLPDITFTPCEPLGL